jgi:dTDP-4-dehydrorhamnose reductase
MRIVVTGASGQLGAYVLDRLEGSGHEVVGWSRSTRTTRGRFQIEPVDLMHSDTLPGDLDRVDPHAVLHLGAISRVDHARSDPSLAFMVNTEAPGTIAHWASSKGRRLVAVSTDLVFDGSRSWWREEDPARPVLEYGRSKQKGERRVLRHASHLVARLPLMYGPSRCGRPTFLDGIFDALRRGEPCSLFVDEFRSPIDYATAADALIRLVESPGITGLLHVAGIERVSRFEMIRRLASHAGLPAELIRGNRQADAPGPEPRPADVSLDTARLSEVMPGLDRPTLEGGLDRCIA